MTEITLQQTPNQSFSFDADGVSYDIAIKTADSVIADISIDSEAKIQGIRVMPYRPIIPYEYLAVGNLFFITENGEAVDYTKFGVTQSLVYLTPEEVMDLNVY